MFKKILLLFVFLSGQKIFAQKFEQLAPTPPMGWNSWNIFQTNINEQLVRDVADAMVSSGMKDAGYSYIVLDDGWMSKERDSITGNLVADPKKFPSGIRALADYIHAKGLKFGLYNCAGTKTCAGYPGTRGYEYQDARYYASVDCDYLKFDWCNTEGINPKEAYATMSKALRAAGRPIVFSLCEWGTSKPWEWASPVGHLWRTTGDIYAQFDSVHHFGNWSALGVMTIVDLQQGLRKYAGPGHWNDPDMLEVGNGLTEAENRAHFSIWCMLAAPLISGNDLRHMPEATRKVLTNHDVVAVDQDPLGIEAFKYSDKDSIQTWFKPLSNGDWAVCFLNRGSRAQQVNFNFQATTIVDSLTNRSLDKKNVYRIQDLWSGNDLGTTKKPVSATVGSHDVLMMRLNH